MKIRPLFFLLVGIMLAAVAACNSSNKSDESEKTQSTKEWIYEVMSSYYFWNEEVHGKVPTEGVEPSKYFGSLLVEEDSWSYITDNYASLAAEMISGTPVSMGFEPTLALYDQNKVMAIVTYVYPNSPAQREGLKRGDIIISINNELININNYDKVYTLSSYTAETADFDYVNNTLVPTGNKYNLTAEVVVSDPSIAHSIIQNNGKKIGYYAYTAFITGKKGEYIESMNNIFAHFKQEGIDELIVDLRYNAGGDVYAAQVLASLIAPETVANQEEKLIDLVFNDLYSQWLAEHKPEGTYYKYIPTHNNLNLDRAYFLTTDGSASASELTIIGLQPYMDVRIVGEPTYGKYTGMYVFADSKEEWAMLPVCMKYANADGYTDFVNGIPVDVAVEDDWLNFVELGSPKDNMIVAVLNDIDGGVILAQKKQNSFPTQHLAPPTRNPLRNNVFELRELN